MKDICCSLRDVFKPKRRQRCKRQHLKTMTSLVKTWSCCTCRLPKTFYDACTMKILHNNKLHEITLIEVLTAAPVIIYYFIPFSWTFCIKNFVTTFWRKLSIVKRERDCYIFKWHSLPFMLLSFFLSFKNLLVLLHYYFFCKKRLKSSRYLFFWSSLLFWQQLKQ